MPLKKNTPITTKISIKKIDENNNVNAGKIDGSIDLKYINLELNINNYCIKVKQHLIANSSISLLTCELLIEFSEFVSFIFSPLIVSYSISSSVQQ